MDMQAYAVGRIAWNLDRALQWLGEGMLSYAAEALESARAWLPRLEGAVLERAETLVHGVAWVVENVAHKLARAARAALAEVLAETALLNRRAA